VKDKKADDKVSSSGIGGKSSVIRADRDNKHDERHSTKKAGRSSASKDRK
jgi:hypothetical protein